MFTIECLEQESNENLAILAQNTNDENIIIRTLYYKNKDFLDKIAKDLYSVSETLYDIEDYISIEYEVLVKAINSFSDGCFTEHLRNTYIKYSEIFQNKTKFYNYDLADNSVEAIVDERLTIQKIFKNISENISKRNYEIFYKKIVLEEPLNKLAEEYGVSRQRISTIVNKIIEDVRERKLVKKVYVYKGYERK